MRNVVIAGYARSPFHLAGKGALARVRPDDLAAQVICGLIEQTGVKAEDIEDIVLGCAFPEGEQGLNVARLIGLLADLPLSVGGMTVNRFCGSSMSSVHIAAGQIQLGAGEAFICAGVEAMSRVPMMGFNPLPNPELAKKNAGAYMGMGDTAENVATKYQISRAQQEAFVRGQPGPQPHDLDALAPLALVQPVLVAVVDLAARMIRRAGHHRHLVPRAHPFPAVFKRP